MKITLYVVTACLATLLHACQSKHQENNNSEILYSLESRSTDGLQRMKRMSLEDDVTWRDAKYHFIILRTSDDSLPKVKDESGDCHVDNTITLTIRRAGGEHFVEKTFTKQSFATVVDDEFLSHALLEGMVFDKVTAEGLVFAASVSYPQSDLFIPVSITIAANGSMTYKKEVSMGENFSGEQME